MLESLKLEPIITYSPIFLFTSNGIRASYDPKGMTFGLTPMHKCYNPRDIQETYESASMIDDIPTIH